MLLPYAYQIIIIIIIIIIIGNVGEAERRCHEVRFETRRCVKMRLQHSPAQEAYCASLDSLAGFGRR